MDTTKKDAFTFVVLLLAIGLFTNAFLAQVCNGEVESPVCNGKYKGIKPAEEELKKILDDHKKWYETYKPTDATEAASVPQDGRAYLCEADLSHIDLSKTDLRFAILRGANLAFADLSETNLRNVNLSGAHLWGAILRKVDLTFADLSGADLRRADLSGSNLWRANFSGMGLRVANLDSVTFELKPGALPLIPDIALAENLSRMQFDESPHSLVELRDAFKKAGFRQQEREITYAIEHTRRKKQMFGEEGTAEKVKGFFKFILFELTCDYGMSPGRPLWTMVGIFLIFFIPYMIALNTQGRAGLWQDWQKDRVLKDDGQEGPIRLHADRCKHRGIWIAIYFSLLSAFHVGWREFNVGQWIIRMQPHEYTLKATGWVKSVSSIQSLISVYLLALSVLSYFGRPFE